MLDQFKYTKLDERDRYEYLLRPERINLGVTPVLKETLDKVDNPTHIFVIHSLDELISIYDDYKQFLTDGNIAIYVSEIGIPEKMFVCCTIDKVLQWKEIAINAGTGAVNLASEIVNGLMTSSDFIKLKGIEEGAIKYIHPAKHIPTDIAEDSTHRFVTDAEKTIWNDKTGSISGGTITGDIIPSTNGTIDLGSTTNRFKALYVNEAYLSTNTLYLGDTAVMGTDLDTINIKADRDQSILVNTTGSGHSAVKSEAGVDITTEGINAHVNISASGLGSNINITSSNDVNITGATGINLQGDVTVGNLNITGSLVASGPNFIVESTTVRTEDNIIELNYGEIGNGVTAGQSGFRIDRGDGADYMLIFDEVDDLIKAGFNGSSLDPLATRPWAQGVFAPISHVGSRDTAHGVATQTQAGFISAADKIKLDGLSSGSNNVAHSTINGNILVNDIETIVYTHPENHLPSVIIQDANNRFVTDVEKSTWNSKATTSYVDTTVATQISNVIIANGAGDKYLANDGTYKTITGSSNEINDTVASINTTYSSTKIDFEIAKKASSEHTHIELHSHENKAVLDSVTALKVTTWDSKAEGNHTHNELHSHTNKAIIDGITTKKVSIWDDKTSKIVTNGVGDMYLANDGTYKTVSSGESAQPDIIEYVTEISNPLTTTDISQESPVGSIIYVLGNVPPNHYLACNGSTLNIADYTFLSEYIRTQFGAINAFGGDGITTFSIPYEQIKITETTIIMTGYTTPSPYVVSASSVYGAGYDAWRVFDGVNASSTDCWASANTTSGWIKIDMSTPKVISKFSITSRNGDTYATASPKTFTLQGSNDDITFIDLLRVENQTGWGSNQTRTFELGKVVNYRYYRLNVESNNGQSYIAIGLLTLPLLKDTRLACIKYEPTHYAVNQYGGFESKVLFEGNANTIGTYGLTDNVENYDFLIICTNTDTNTGDTGLITKASIIPTNIINYTKPNQFAYERFTNVSTAYFSLQYHFSSKSLLSIDYIVTSTVHPIARVTKVIGYMGQLPTLLTGGEF